MSEIAQKKESHSKEIESHAPQIDQPSQPVDRHARAPKALVDRYGRVHRSLRISVTDACNIRCSYCMPEEGAKFLPKSQLLSFDKIERFTRCVVNLGIRSVRLTGGEPLLRPRLHELVGRLSAIQGIDDIAMTSNGMLLAEQLPQLVDAGLSRVNISLDTLSAATFKRLARREGLDRVMQGIQAASAMNGLDVKLNALILRDVNLSDVLDLVSFASEQALPLRFIEFMPLDAERAWSGSRMVSGEELRELIATRFGPLERVPSDDPSRPSMDYRFASGRAGMLGFIDSVSTPFCGRCDRIRLTAEGKIRNCLFGQQEWDIGKILDEQEDDTALIAALMDCVSAKHPAHGIAEPGFEPPQRAMYQIGG